MKTATYRLRNGETRTIEYDPQAPCVVCGEPVIEASMAGTVVCPWCDMGKCRYCGVQSMLFKEELDGGGSLREWRDHMKWHHDHPSVAVVTDTTLSGS